MSCLVCNDFDPQASAIGRNLVICVHCRKNTAALHQAIHIGNLTTVLDIERKKYMKLMYELYILPLRDQATKGEAIKASIVEVKENLRIVDERIMSARKEITTHARN